MMIRKMTGIILIKTTLSHPQKKKKRKSLKTQKEFLANPPPHLMVFGVI